MVIIIDALDECDLENEVKVIIHHFGRARSLGLKIIVTSRPELPIRLGFSAIKGKYQEFILQEISQPVIKHDLSLFLEHELATIRARYNSSVPEDRHLDADWPGQSSIDALVTGRIGCPLSHFVWIRIGYYGRTRGSNIMLL